MLGIGTRVPVSRNSLPQPDAFVKSGPATGSNVTDDALVLFEVLSRSNTRTDQSWRRRVYARIPKCGHYVTVSLKTPEVVAYDRAAGWAGRTVTDLGSSLDLPVLGVSIPLAEIYCDTSLGNT